MSVPAPVRTDQGDFVVQSVISVPEAGATALVSWWASPSDFQAYMKSEDHRRSHARIPRGELRPRAVSVQRFSVICE